MEMRIVDFVTSLEGWKDFKDSFIWKDMKSEFGLWLDDIHAQLEDPNGELSDKRLHRLGGNAETLHNVLNFVDIIIDTNEEKITFPELDNEDED